MKSENDGIQKIFMRPAYITEKERRNPDSPREYYIYYKWRGKDTAKKGRFIGEFLIELSTESRNKRKISYNFAFIFFSFLHREIHIVMTSRIVKSIDCPSSYNS